MNAVWAVTGSEVNVSHLARTLAASGQTEKDGQRSGDRQHCLVIKMAKWSSELFALHRHGLVDHDLRRLMQSIFCCRLDGRPDQRGFHQCPDIRNTVTVPVASNWSDWMMRAGRSFPKSPGMATVTRSPRLMRWPGHLGPPRQHPGRPPASDQPHRLQQPHATGAGILLQSPGDAYPAPRSVPGAIPLL
ncbi:hypothetical protein ABIB57_005420 [Devosia sp. UYZn731]